MVQAVAVIVERIADTAFRAPLPNGKTAVAFVEKKNASLRELLKPGDVDFLHSLEGADVKRAMLRQVWTVLDSGSSSSVTLVSSF